MDSNAICNEPIEEKGMSSATLKLIAYITMLIDHATHVLLENNPNIDVYGNLRWNMLDLLLRGIGRLAFIIFAYQLAKGMEKARSKAKYVLRLAIMAVVSEIPFDMAISGKFFEWTDQNVCITLLIGALCIWGIQVLADKGVGGKILSGVIFLAGMALAAVLKTDYSFFGVLLVVVLYLARKDSKRQVTIGIITTIVGSILMYAASAVIEQGEPLDFYTIVNVIVNAMFESIGAISFAFIGATKGRKGKMLNKWFYYCFYPVHLLILGIISMLIF